MAPPPPSSSSHPPPRRAKRLPLSSTSTQHNKLRTPSSPSPTPTKLVRSVKSNPSLPRQPRPPPLGTFPSTSTTTTTTSTSNSSSSSCIPHSPSYPLLNSEETTSLQRLGEVTFAKEIFLHRHERDFPHLHEVIPPNVVRRDTPASAVSSEEASVVGDGGAASPEVVEEEEEKEKQELSTPRRKVRPLSLVMLQPKGGLFSPKEEEEYKQEEVMPSSRPTSVVERLVEREKERESLDLDRRSSDEISSECDLDFAFDHTNNTPPPPPRFKPTTTSIPPRPAFNVVPTAAPLAVKFASSTTAGHPRRPFAPPPPPSTTTPTPSTSGSSSYTLPLGPNLFPTSLPPTPETASYPFPSPPPPVASRRPLPTNPSSSSGHRRGPSITYRRSSSSPLISPPIISASLSPAPSAVAEPLSTSASNSTMTSSGSIRVPRRMTSVEMERELFWHPSMVEKQEERLESMREEAAVGESGGSGKGKEREEGERPGGIGGAKRLDSGSSLVRKSASEGVGLRERYQEVGNNKRETTTSLYGSTPNTPNSPYGFIHNPTPPSIHFNAPSSDAGSSRSSWRDWFGGASSSRRGSEIKHSADVLERGEAGSASGSGALRPGWMSRKGSLPLPSPNYSFVSSGSGSGSSFGNAPGEIWSPSSPSSPSLSPNSNGTFGPISPQQAYSPSFPPGTDLRPPPQAVTIRRPLVSTSANATLAGNGRTSPSLSQQPQPLHRGLKPLELTLPPKPLRKKAGGLFSSGRAPLAPIAGSPSKRDLEEGRGVGPLVEQSRSRTRSAPSKGSGSGSEEDENDESTSPTPLEGYRLQSSHTPSSTPLRLRSRSGEPSFALAVHPSTPLRYPSPPSPSLDKTSVLPSHRRTYSTATSTTFSPSESKGSISYRPHNHTAPLILNSTPSGSTETVHVVRRQSFVTFHDASSSDGTGFVVSAASAAASSSEQASKAAGVGSSTLFNSTSTTGTYRGNGGGATAVRPMSMLSMQSVYQRVMNAPRTWLDEVLPSQLIFMAGFLLGPWCWILGGWGLSSDGRLILTQLQGARPRTTHHLSPSANQQQRRQPRWGSASARRSSFHSERSSSSLGGGEWASSSLHQQYQGQKWRTRSGTSVNGGGGRKKWLLPVLRSEGRDKWVWRCRVAAILSGCVFIPGLVLAVVFAAL